MTFYEEATGETFVSTMDSPNRLRDAARLAPIWDHPHRGESGQADCPLYTRRGMQVASGYLRIVFGDHGPYVEFLKDQMVRGIWTWVLKGPNAWYDEAYPKDGSGLKLYLQKKDVTMLPNPPAGQYSCRNNRKEGYADYRVGRVYISPDDLEF